MTSVAFHTLGCKLNFAETSAMRRTFEGGEYEIRGFDAPADIYVINTCSVTEDANRECRKVVRQALRRNPDAFVAVTGCYAQLEPGQIAAIDGVSLVVGSKDKFSLPELVQRVGKTGHAIVQHSDVNESVEFHHAISSGDRTRAFLKIQDGCDYKCAFCTIPMARGASRSPRIESVLDQARKAVAEGFREIILTGVNAGDFGKANGETFHDLLLALERVEGIERIRTSSIEPNLLEERTIRHIAASERIMPHLHMPLQSGSDDMLRLMKRRYRRDLYADKVALIRDLMPHAAIGVDVITGHPGETEERFRDSFDFIEGLDVSYLHVFTYSERPNTAALDITPVVPVEERRRRNHQLRKLSDLKRHEFESRFKGQPRPVLFESEVSDGMISGYTDNYIRVSVPYEAGLVNALRNSF